MATAPGLAATLLQTGLLTGCVLVAQVVVVRRLPIQTIPLVLRDRAAMCTRLRPWLLFAATTMIGVGLLLQAYS